MLAMHSPDGFLQGHVEVVAALVSLVVVGVALRRAQLVDHDRARLAVVTAAGIFASQMVNVPVADGTTGHLIGGALAAALLGPWLGTLAMTAVIATQAVVFADGGLVALGVNVLNMAIVPVVVAWGVLALCRRALPETTASVALAGGVAGAASVLASAVAFSLEWSLGPSTNASAAEVFTAMVGAHIPIGLGEGLLTAALVASGLAARPDLVAAASHLDPAALDTEGRPRTATFLVVGLAGALVVAAGLSQAAAGDPDGLERVAIDQGFIASAEEHPLVGSPFADYATAPVDHEALGPALAGAVGVALTLAVAGALVAGARRLGGEPRHAAPAPA